MIDGGCERDPVRLIQALLILAYGCCADEEEFLRARWLKVTVELCRRLRLDREPPAILGTQCRSYWKRIWWSVYVLDTVVAMHGGFEPHFADGAIHSSDITMDDFELHSIRQAEALADLTGAARFFVERARLCRQSSIRNGKSPVSDVTDEFSAFVCERHFDCTGGWRAGSAFFRDSTLAGPANVPGCALCEILS